MRFFLSLPHPIGGCHKLRGNASRRCAFECLEPRQLLAADLTGGAADVSFGHTDGLTGSISGSVFATASAASCDSHVGTDSLADVRIQLLNEAGAVLEESSTDAQGVYRFADLIPGQYAVRQLTQNALLEGDSLEGASHVGDGGGIAFDSNLVGEIVVEAGAALEGYDFCEFTSVVEPAGPTDRPIVHHDNINQVLPYLTLPLQSTPAAQRQIFAEPRVELTTGTPLAISSPLPVKRPAEIYGGSSQTLKGPAESRVWEEFPLDGFFSTASFLELATAELPTVESFEPIIREAHPSEPLFSAAHSSKLADESSETHLADGYTTNSTEWWEIDAHTELDELMGDVAIIDLDVETADVAAVTKIARLHKIN